MKKEDSCYMISTLKLTSYAIHSQLHDLHIPGEQHQVPTRTEFIQHDDSMKHHMGKHIDCKYTTYISITLYMITLLYIACMNNLHMK